MKEIVKYKRDNNEDDDEVQMIRDIGVKKVALACGLSVSHFSEYLSGKRTIKGDDYDKVMEYIFKNWKPKDDQPKQQ